MAEIVVGIGAPNSPLLVMDGSIWEERGAVDRRNTNLIDVDGSKCTYDELAAKTANRYTSVATSANFKEQAAAAQKLLDRLAAELAEAKPEVVILLSHDNGDIFTPQNQPVMCVYYGEKMISQVAKLAPDAPQWAVAAAKGQGQDTHREYEVASDFARELIIRLMAHKCDTASAGELPNPDEHAFGYSFSFPMERLMGGRKMPVVPILLNSLHPPNQPTPRRCYEIGRLLRAAIADTAPNTRVAILASAGMSHFVVNEELDRKVLKAFKDGDADALRSLPVKLLAGNNGQIRDLIVMAGAMEGRPLKWSEYMPVYRTPAGTGIGIAGMSW